MSQKYPNSQVREVYHIVQPLFARILAQIELPLPASAHANANANENNNGEVTGVGFGRRAVFTERDEPWVSGRVGERARGP